MDIHNFRKQFAEFVGPETLGQFMTALHRNPVCRKRLLFWQEKLLEEFLADRGLGKMEHEQVLELFTYCHLHGRELSAGNAGNISSYYDAHMDRSSLFYRQAYRRMELRRFPFAVYPLLEITSGSAGQGRHCPECIEEKRRYVEGTHRTSMALANYDMYVCDIEQECLKIYDRLGEDCGVGRMEGLGLYFVERRTDRSAADPALAELAGMLDDTAREILAAYELLLDEDPALKKLEAFLQEKKGLVDVEKSLEKLKSLFDLDVEGDEDREILNACQWLYFVVCELRKEQQR